MADQRTTDAAITAVLAAVLAATENLELPVTVEYSRRPPPLPGATGEVDATIRDDADEPLAAFVPMDVDAASVDTATDAQAEAIATILNDAPLLAAELRDLHAAGAAGADVGSLARVLASPEGEAIVDPADRQRLIELVAAAVGGRALTVGAALAMPEVQRGEAVVEYRWDTFWWRVAIDHRGIRLHRWSASAKRRWVSSASDQRKQPAVYALPCRLVPIAEADADPNTRGPLT